MFDDFIFHQPMDDGQTLSDDSLGSGSADDASAGSDLDSTSLFSSSNPTNLGTMETGKFLENEQWNNWSGMNVEERFNTLDDFFSKSRADSQNKIELGWTNDGTRIQFGGDKIIIDEEQLKNCQDPTTYVNDIIEGVDTSDETDFPKDGNGDDLERQHGDSNISFGGSKWDLCDFACHKYNDPERWFYRVN